MYALFAGLFQVNGSEAGGEPERKEDDQDKRHDESRPKVKGSATGALDSGSIAKHWPDTVNRVGKDGEKVRVFMFVFSFYPAVEEARGFWGCLFSIDLGRIGGQY